jgi:DNA repair photolyase
LIIPLKTLRVSNGCYPDLHTQSTSSRDITRACIYCFARPTHAYLGLSPGLDFETRIFRKKNAAELLDRELRAKNYVCQPLAIGANTDPYQPIERTERITRAVLEVCRDFNQPVGLITKSALVTRDLDILGPMAERGLAAVAVSVTTLDRGLARRMEPRASTPGRRLEAVRELTEAGVPVSVLASPMIPGLNDHELEAILAAGAEGGAVGGSYIMLRLPLEIKELFEERNVSMIMRQALVQFRLGGSGLF